MKNKDKVQKVIAEIEIEEVYYAATECPYCGAGNNSEIEQDNITLTERCWKCEKKYKMKIPKNSI